MIFRSEVMWAEEGFCEDFDFGFEKNFLGVGCCKEAEHSEPRICL